MGELRPINVIVLGLMGLFVATLIGIGIAKARRGDAHASRELERIPRVMAAEADLTLTDWFRNMDRDADGKLTRAEFLGTDEQFKRIDTNGNGEISPTEARAADEWFRKSVPD
ncbi:calmodulin : Uncharacterized protein OS=Rhodopirellula baltica SWK14 GN=RBSWK_04062 PE=4 SV=1: EF-hand_5: EF-hand_5 [Gemmata massiliana]|uniref:EF-hand domain-containing protein n=1 Tax=Gemmata massiliana TaxID=1210884 RepID=A0A6P2D207_9BACT|nr:hypothetical protein [Gemmata massiliana]VTR95321.1 calmodulin : Uncharacterized protein OS=Rhodopirellula baltica SWK14 GN=RBSWK_04062 PE=4 SV=1: EF-hand_5: EF-hand_5 [Gemmata massiliana]